jgi:hypothetical protein
MGRIPVLEVAVITINGPCFNYRTGKSAQKEIKTKFFLQKFGECSFFHVFSFYWRRLADKITVWRTH